MGHESRYQYVEPQSAHVKESPEEIRRQVADLIDRDLARRHVDRFEPLPNASVVPVLPDLAPTTGNILIPLKRVISRLGITLRLLVPTL